MDTGSPDSDVIVLVPELMGEATRRGDRLDREAIFGVASYARRLVVARPVAGELLKRRQLHAVLPISDELLGGPPRRGDALPEVSDRFVGHVDPEGNGFRFRRT